MNLSGGGCHRIRISIEGIDAEAYHEISGVKIDWESFVGNIKDLYDHKGDCEIYIKTVDAAVDTAEKKERFLTTFGDICDQLFIENLAPIWAGFDEIEERFKLNGKMQMDDQAVRYKKVCPFPFYQMFIHADGTVVPCCADWQQRLPLGNVKDAGLQQIWFGEAYNKLCRDMLTEGRTCRGVCGDCKYPDTNGNDDIDAYADKLLPKYCTAMEERL